MSSRTRLHALLGLLLTLVCVALILLAPRLASRHDLTSNGRNSLAHESIAAAESVQQAVDVVAVMGNDAAARAQVRDLIERYSEHNPLITLRFLNPETDPAAARAIGADPNGELLLRRGERSQSVRQLSERALTAALRRLGRDHDRTITFTTGHEERSPSGAEVVDWGMACAQLARTGLKCTEQSLVGQPVVTDETDVLVIADPQRAFFPGEVASLLDYIGRGGNLLWIAETEARDSLDLALKPLATELGVTLLPGTVIDQASMELEAGSATFVVLDRFPDHLISRNLSSWIMLPEAAALGLDRLAGQSFSPLLQTPSASWTELGALSGAVQFDEGSEERVGPLMLGLTLERARSDGTLQRMAVLGDADFAANRFVGNGANLALIDSLLTWLAGDVEALDFITRPAPDAELVMNQAAIIGVTAVWLAAVPAALLLLAAALYWRRRRES